MEWDFTPEDVRSGKADYSVAEFKEDLLEEINENLAEFKGNEQKKQFFSVLTIMLCTSLALGHSVKGFIKSQKQYFPSQELQKFVGNKELLQKIKENNKENIEMLRVVIKKRIQDDVEKEIPPVDIVKNITSELLEI
jgi:hypothetical protein